VAIRLVVSMQAAPGKREALIAAFRTLCPSVQEEPGCQQYELHQSLEAPDRFALLERWDDEETLKVHIQRLQERNLNLNALRAGPPTVERYTV
jgi:quinol monooxygenase YgiN